MSLTLRSYHPGDFPTLYAIDQACYPPGISYSKRILRWFLGRPGAQCLVAESDGGIAGFVLAEQEEETAHLITIDVLVTYRRRGVAAALLDTLENTLAARGVRHVELETAIDNQPGIAFWQKHGYRTLGVLKRYYLDRIDAYSMFKPLAPAKDA